MCGVEARVHAAAGETTSLGAAIAAGVGAGIFADYSDGAAKVRSKARFSPDPEQAKAYEQIYPVYAAIYDRVKPIFDEIALSGRFS